MGNIFLTKLTLNKIVDRKQGKNNLNFIQSALTILPETIKPNIFMGSILQKHSSGRISVRRTIQ